VTALVKRQAEFVYEGARLAAIAAKAPVIPAPFGEREEAFKSQFFNVIEQQMGNQRSNSPEELHGSWMQAYFAMGWKFGERYSREQKMHPDLVPYAQLGQLERDKDAVFVMLCEIARQYIYDFQNTATQPLTAEDEWAMSAGN
jgi:RyR domain